MKKWIVGAIIVIATATATFYAVTHRNESSPLSQKITLRVPDTRFMGILPLYVAEEKGFFEQEGIAIQWIDVRDPGQAEKIFHAGQADFFMTTFANLIPAEVRKPGTIRLLYPIYESAEQPGSYILVRSDSDIKTVQDLHGKTLGTYSGPSQKAYALIVLQKIGLREPDDVRLIQVASSTQVQCLFGGVYDALFTVETFGSTAISKGARIVESGVRTKYINNPFWLGSAAISASLAKNQPQIIVGILNALGKAAKYIKEHEVEAREILAQRTNTEKEVAQRCALYTWVTHPTNQDLKQIQGHVDLLMAEKLIDKSVVVTDIFEGVLNEK